MIPVLVPRRLDNGRRDSIWSHLQSTYWDGLPYSIVVGSHIKGPFNRSMALNKAAIDAGDWSLAIIADADTYVPSNQLEEAISICSYTGHTTIAFSHWFNLKENVTVKMLEGNYTGPMAWDVMRSGLTGVSGMTVITRETWDHIGGFDEGFIGYGWEDLAFDSACRIIGPVERITGPCWHLNHPRPPFSKSDVNFNANKTRYLLSKS